VLPIPAPWTDLVLRCALILLDPPWCYGPSPSPRIDVAVLSLQAARGGIVLTDIPDDWDSLEEALAVPGVVGAIAVACDGIDLWVAPEYELPLDVPLRRTTETTAARFELRTLDEAEQVLTALAAQTGGQTLRVAD
jgi:hypothetical protein